MHVKGWLHEIFPRLTAILSHQSNDATHMICYLSLHIHKIHLCCISSSGKTENGAVNIQNSRSIDQLKNPLIYDV